MILAEKLREITRAALRAEEKEINERVEDYVERLVSQAVKEAKKGRVLYATYFSLPMTLWDKAYWRLTQAGYAVYYRQNTNEIEIRW